MVVKCLLEFARWLTEYICPEDATAEEQTATTNSNEKQNLVYWATSLIKGQGQPRSDFAMMECELQRVVQEIFEMKRRSRGGTIIFNVKKRPCEDAVIADLVATSSGTYYLHTTGLAELFDTRRKGHDGAIIISLFSLGSCFSPSISATQCWLPIDVQLAGVKGGTRHRSAATFSQITDAPIVVVSEEQGVASFVRDGHIIYDVRQEDCMNQLRCAIVEELLRKVRLQAC